MSFFENFFSEYSDMEPNMQGEISVLCPFPHDKGYERNPSAHVNLAKGVFHCKTCQAEGRFNDGGLSEIGFVSHLYGISYEEAVRIMTTLDGSNRIEDEESWTLAAENLFSMGKDLVEYLKGRGISEETIRKYKLGYTGDGVAYPVFIYGRICQTRSRR